MNIIFLTLLDISDINERGIYHDLLRKFRDEGHQVYVVYPSERRKNAATAIRVEESVKLLNVRTLNIQKTNVFEKGLGTLLLEYQFLSGIKKFFSNVRFDLVLYSTPPITLGKVIQYIKQKDCACSYLLLKDIFPQNAVDLGMIRKGGILHRFFSKKEKQLYLLSDFIGCMSPANVHYLLSNNKELLADRVEVNPNSIAPVSYEFSPTDQRRTRDRYHIPQEAIVFIYGGNLGKPQGVDFLIEVLSSNENDNKLFFVVVGNGTEYGKIDKWVKWYKPRNILLLPGLPKKEYDDLVKACDVGLIFLDKRFTIPNFPSRLLSYLEYSMPVIAATDRHTDIGEIIEEAGAGFWTQAGDVQEFNKLVNKLSTNPNLITQMGGNAYRLLQTSYTVEVSYNAIIRRIV
jgi:glycosyltransferase involved in cell wall biosynthesis